MVANTSYIHNLYNLGIDSYVTETITFEAYDLILIKLQSILIWKDNLWQARWNLFRIFADMWALYSSFLAESPQETEVKLRATNKNGQNTSNKLICVRKVLWSQEYILIKKKNHCITQVRPRLPPGRVRPLK